MNKRLLLLVLLLVVGVARAAYVPPNPNGQATMANSTPVVVASNQTALPVTGTFWQATQPVSGTFWQVTQPVSGPLTDAQMRASAVPVSGTFWQATQPISGTVTANAGTGTFAVSGPLTDAQLRDSALPVSMTSTTITGTVAATQSGTWTVQPGNTANTTAWKVDGSAVTQPVSGTFWQATQPVSLATAPVLVAGTAIIGKVGIDQTTPGTTNGVQVNAALPTGANVIGAVTQSGTWNVGAVTTLPALPANQTVDLNRLAGTTPDTNSGSKSAGTLRVVLATDQPQLTNKLLVTPDANSSVNVAQVNGVAVSTGSGVMGTGVQRVAIASNNDALSVTPPTLTKGTQGATGFSVQSLKDAGRTAINFYANAAAAGTTTTETAITLTKSSGTAATSTGTSFVITSGKRFRIMTISVATRGHTTATAQTTTFNLRINTAGAVTTSTTPIVFSARSATPATASAWDRYVIPIPDGYEILGDGTLQFGITAAATYTTNAPTWDVTILGFEY